jgi:small subunit ribosomal protein S3e
MTDVAPAAAPVAPEVRPQRAVNKKRHFVADGVFYAELNEFLARELGEDGYSGVQIVRSRLRTEVIIRATKTTAVLGERSRRIRELTSLVQKRFGFAEGSIELFAERVQNRGLSAIAQAESLRFRLLQGIAVRRAASGVLKYIMENGAKGVSVVIAGKLRGQRAKSMKFLDGYMVKSGEPARSFVDSAVRHIKLKQGVLGICVKIMLPTTINGDGKNQQPDVVKVHEPKEETPVVNNQTGGAKQGFGQQVSTNEAPVQQQQPAQQ